MEQDMRKDAELLNALLDETPVVLDRRMGRQVVVNAKLIAHWTGRSIQTVSDYRTGKLNIPVEFWRLILEHMFNLRIINLILPDSIMFEAIATESIAHKSAPEFFRQAVEAEGEHHEKMKYLTEILADGRVDELDGATVQEYDDAYMEHRTRDAVLHRSIIHTYQREVARQEARRS